jgi:hypothetical protein
MRSPIVDREKGDNPLAPGTPSGAWRPPSGYTPSSAVSSARRARQERAMADAEEAAAKSVAHPSHEGSCFFFFFFFSDLFPIL